MTVPDSSAAQGAASSTRSGRRALHRLVILSALATVALTTTALAQPTPAAPSAMLDTAGVGAALARARGALEGLEGLWGARGDGARWIFTDGRRHVASDPAIDGGALAPMTLPPATVIANHAVEIDGRRWAMIRLPLGGDEDARARLLVHEVLHTLQPEHLPSGAATEPADGGDHLDSAAGRVWLLLELRALSAALATAGEARRRALSDALVFRAERDRLATPTERARMDALDVVEGLPEYTAWRLAGASDRALADGLARAERATVSWVRAVGYWTGPAYGFLLDQLSTGAWREAVRVGARLPMLLAKAIGAPRTHDAAHAAQRAAVWNGATLQATEHARDSVRAHERATLRARFVTGPVLRVRPHALRIAFDPNSQVPLGADGTLMRGLRWSDADGSLLEAPAGALVSADWAWLQLPLDGARPLSRLSSDGRLTERLVLQGEGWTLTLAPGWRLRAVPEGVEAEPPREPH